MTTSAKISIFFLLFFCAILFSPAFAMDTYQNISSLRGLDGVGVLVEPLSPEIETSSLNTEKIEKQIRDQLKQAGIHVYGKEDFLVSLGRPAVYVNTEISRLETEKGEVWGYLCSIDIALTQHVYLVRSPDQAVPASTWEAGALGLFPDMTLITEKVKEAVGAFIAAYQIANAPAEKVEENNVPVKEQSK